VLRPIAPQAGHAAMLSPPDLVIREDSKSATRAWVMQAARALFGEVGYEKATIRMIAERAGVASGSVFTTFSNKNELLLKVLQEKYQELLARLEPAIGAAPTTLAALSDYARIAYAFELQEPRLLAEQIGASWVWDQAADRMNRRKIAPLGALLLQCITAGKERGEIDANADAAMVADLVFGIYVRNYRRAFFEGFTPAELGQLFDTQVRTLFNGLVP
jgi:AcrR family transcriptional regulator